MIARDKLGSGKYLFQKHQVPIMRKYIRAILIFIIFFSLFGGAYAFTSRDINPLLRDYLFFGILPVSGISVLILGGMLIFDNIKES